MTNLTETLETGYRPERHPQTVMNDINARAQKLLPNPQDKGSHQFGHCVAPTSLVVERLDVLFPLVEPRTYPLAEESEVTVEYIPSSSTELKKQRNPSQRTIRILTPSADGALAERTSLKIVGGKLPETISRQNGVFLERGYGWNETPRYQPANGSGLGQILAVLNVATPKHPHNQ